MKRLKITKTFYERDPIYGGCADSWAKDDIYVVGAKVGDELDGYFQISEELAGWIVRTGNGRWMNES